MRWIGHVRQGNLITRFHLKVLPKRRKNYKNIAFRGRSAATVLQINTCLHFGRKYTNDSRHLARKYLTIIPWARVGYEMIDSQQGA